MINAIATKAISQAFDKSLKDAVLPFTGSRKGFGGDGGVREMLSLPLQFLNGWWYNRC